jgi:hypothetical protein
MVAQPEAIRPKKRQPVAVGNIQLSSAKKLTPSNFGSTGLKAPPQTANFSSKPKAAYHNAMPAGVKKSASTNSLGNGGGGEKASRSSNSDLRIN